MTKKKLTPAQKARKLVEKEKFEWVFINGKQKKVRKHIRSDNDFVTWDGKSSLAEYLVNLEIIEFMARENQEHDIKEINVELRLISNELRSFPNLY